MHGIKKAAVAEAYGTFLLTLLGPGSIIAMSFVEPGSAAALGFIGLAHGVALLVAVYSIGHISGAHINPAVTIAQWATHRIERKRVFPYLVAQFAGASVAGFTLLVLWSSTGTSAINCPRCVAQSTFLGNNLPGSAFGDAPALVAEVIATAILVFTIFAVTDKDADKSWAGVVLGLVLAALIWIFGPISGASLNPARTWGPTLASAAFSLTPFATLWIYIIGPVLGGLLGGFLYDTLK